MSNTDNRSRSGPPRRGGGRDRKMRRRHQPPEWIPRTSLGDAVKSGLITSIEEIFQNNYKDKDTHPDYKIYLSTPRGEVSPHSSEEDTIPF